MKLHKKATAWTNPYLLLSILLLVGVFSYIIISMGEGLANNPNTSLNAQSYMFIANETGRAFKINNKSIDDINFMTETQLKTVWYASENQTRDLTKDYSLDFFFGLDSISKIWDTMKSIYNLPSLLIRWLPFDNGAFSFIINAFSLFFWLVLAGVVIYIVRGFNIGR